MVSHGRRRAVAELLGETLPVRDAHIDRLGGVSAHGDGRWSRLWPLQWRRSASLFAEQQTWAGVGHAMEPRRRIQ